LLTGKPVRPYLGMTGEITLRGKVLPIGGLKEKVLAAARFGIKTVIIPKRNEADLDDVPESVRKTIKFILVDTVDEVLAAALDTPEEENKKANLPASAVAANRVRRNRNKVLPELPATPL